MLKKKKKKTAEQEYAEYIASMRKDAEQAYEEEARYLPNHPGDTFEERRVRYIADWMQEFADDFETWRKRELWMLRVYRTMY